LGKNLVAYRLWLWIPGLNAFNLVWLLCVFYTSFILHKLQEAIPLDLAVYEALCRVPLQQFQCVDSWMREQRTSLIFTTVGMVVTFHGAWRQILSGVFHLESLGKRSSGRTSHVGIASLSSSAHKDNHRSRAIGARKRFVNQRLRVHTILEMTLVELEW
jgi:hypothetical protein